MKRRILSIILALVLCSLLLPVMATQAVATDSTRPSDEFIQDRIDQLYDWLGGGYFNVNRNTDCGSTSSGHGCSKCRLSNVVAQEWFQNEFTSKVNVKQFNNTSGSSNSCMAFVWFAEWYIFRANDADTVLRDDDGILYFYGKNIRKGVEENAKLGDYFRINNHHSAIYLGCDENGINVLECNRSGDYNCQVTKGVWTWDSLSKISINRFYSKSGNYCPHSEGYKTVQGEDGAYDAICKGCGERYAIGSLDTSSKGIYTAKTAVNVCSAPYQDASFLCYKKGAKITIVGSVKNAYGNTWYKTGGGDWIYSQNLKKTASYDSTLSISGETYPAGTLKKGRGFVLRGKISSNYKITEVNATVYNSENVAKLSYSKSWNSKIYDIYSDGLNRDIAFGKLAAGNYTYVVTATDASGVTLTLVESVFTIK